MTCLLVLSMVFIQLGIHGLSSRQLKIQVLLDYQPTHPHISMLYGETDSLKQVLNQVVACSYSCWPASFRPDTVKYTPPRTSPPTLAHFSSSPNTSSLCCQWDYLLYDNTCLASINTTHHIVKHRKSLFASLGVHLTELLLLGEARCTEKAQTINKGSMWRASRRSNNEACTVVGLNCSTSKEIVQVVAS